jgi:hypothetical protein
MTHLEDLQPTAAVRGILPDQILTVVSVKWFGSEALELTYKTPSGRVANELLYRHDEPRLQVVEYGRPWSFDGSQGSRIFQVGLTWRRANFTFRLDFQPEKVIIEENYDVFRKLAQDGAGENGNEDLFLIIRQAADLQGGSD